MPPLAPIQHNQHNRQGRDRGHVQDNQAAHPGQHRNILPVAARLALRALLRVGFQALLGVGLAGERLLPKIAIALFTVFLYSAISPLSCALNSCHSRTTSPSARSTP
jgi:hypothetical protein